MQDKPLNILVIGATGSVGRHVVSEAISQGHTVRALVRDTRKGRLLGDDVELFVGDLTKAESLSRAVQDIDAVVFTHGSDGAGKVGSERVDYGGVRNLLFALGGNKARIALMTSIGVTNRTGSYNQSTEAHDWKRRGERLVRASGMPYTIVRPGWFDYNGRDQHKIVFLQGDKRQSGTPSDGVIARKQIAKVLVDSLTCDDARGKTLELVAEVGAGQSDLTSLFASLAADEAGRLDAVRDTDNMPLDDEPSRVTDDLHAVQKHAMAQ